MQRSGFRNARLDQLDQKKITDKERHGNQAMLHRVVNPARFTALTVAHHHYLWFSPVASHMCLSRALRAEKLCKSRGLRDCTQKKCGETRSERGGGAERPRSPQSDLFLFFCSLFLFWRAPPCHAARTQGVLHEEQRRSYEIWCRRLVSDISDVFTPEVSCSREPRGHPPFKTAPSALRESCALCAVPSGHDSCSHRVRSLITPSLCRLETDPFIGRRVCACSLPGYPKFSKSKFKLSSPGGWFSISG